MSQTIELVRDLVARRDVLISEHGYDELAQDEISVDDTLMGVAKAAVVEDYPNYLRVLVCLYCSATGNNEQFMSFGEFPRVSRRRQSW